MYLHNLLRQDHRFIEKVLSTATDMLDDRLQTKRSAGVDSRTS